MKSEDEVRQLSAEASRIWTSPIVRDFMENYIQTLFVDFTNAQTDQELVAIKARADAAASFKAAMLRHIAGGRALEKKKGIGDTIGPII